MTKNLETTLIVNTKTIELSPFPADFLTNVVLAAVSSLKGGEVITSLELYLKEDEVQITVNGKPLIIIAFPNDVIVNTLTGLVSTLKGVEKIETIQITIKSL